MDISWYMRSLNEYIARKANREDRCKGRFWEGRFKSQALLDEGALLTCMAYVDLNPVRAGVATTLESSEFTSIQERIDACQKGEVGVDALMDFLPTEYSSELRVTEYLPFKLTEYLELVDWAGRSVRTDKNGAISERAPPILTRVGLYDEKWLKTVCSFESTFHRVIGAVDKINRLAIALGRQWMQGLSAALNLYV